MEVISRPSPNFGPRKGGAAADLIVLHYTAMETSEAALERLCDPAAEVSCHYLIGKAGEIYRLVAEEMRAWHAGAGQWGAVTDVNSRSIGVELCNTGPLKGLPPYPDAQIRALIGLVVDIRARRSISPERVIGHADMAPARKADPGPAFDWRRLALAGQSVWAAGRPGSGTDPQDGAPSWTRFQRAACRFGYSSAVAQTDLLQAFRLRFAPQRLGQPLAAADIAQAEALAARYPCIDAAPPSA